MFDPRPSAHSVPPREAGRVLAGSVRYQPAASRSVAWLAWAALALAVLPHFLSRDITRSGEILLLIVTLAMMGRVWRIDPGRWLYVVVVLYAVWMGSIDYLYDVAGEAVNVEQYPRRYLKQYGFLLAGWWVAARTRLPAWLLGAGVAGCAAGLIYYGNLSDWSRAWFGGREDFGFHNAQHTALYATTCLFAIAYLLGCAQCIRYPVTRWLSTLGASSALLIALFVIHATQTRQSWIGLAVALIGLGIILVFRYRLSGLCSLWRRYRGWLIGCVATLLAIGVVLSPFEELRERTQSEWQTVTEVVNGEQPDDYRSIGVRLATWRVGIEAVRERPLTGYGGGSGGAILSRSDLPDTVTTEYGHFHNSYLESVIHYGLPGLFFWLVGPVYLLTGCLIAHRRGEIGDGTMAVAAGWLLYFLTVNHFETYINYDSSYYVMLFMGGAIHAWIAKPLMHSLNQRRSVPYRNAGVSTGRGGQRARGAYRVGMRVR